MGMLGIKIPSSDSNSFRKLGSHVMLAKCGQDDRLNSRRGTYHSTNKVFLPEKYHLRSVIISAEVDSTDSPCGLHKTFLSRHGKSHPHPQRIRLYEKWETCVDGQPR